MNIDSLYLYLLNRIPTGVEKRNSRNLKLEQINKNIIVSEEYKKFMDGNYQFIKKRLVSIFHSNYNPEQKVLYDLYVVYRSNKYNNSMLDRFLLEKKKKFEIRLGELLLELGISKLEIVNYVNRWLELYVNNNFNIGDIEFNLIHSDFYYQWSNLKLSRLV